MWFLVNLKNTDMNKNICLFCATIYAFVLVGQAEDKFKECDSTCSEQECNIGDNCTMRICTGKAGTIKCTKGVISITKFFFGRTALNVCVVAKMDASCLPDAVMTETQISNAKRLCNNETECNLLAAFNAKDACGNSVWGDPCPSYSKYIRTEYECIDIDVPDLWSKWSPWGACNATCGEGIKTRNRTCVDMPEKHCTKTTCFAKDLSTEKEVQHCSELSCPAPATTQHFTSYLTSVFSSSSMNNKESSAMLSSHHVSSTLFQLSSSSSVAKSSLFTILLSEMELSTSKIASPSTSILIPSSPVISTSIYKLPNTSSITTSSTQSYTASNVSLTSNTLQTELFTSIYSSSTEAFSTKTQASYSFSTLDHSSFSKVNMTSNAANFASTSIYSPAESSTELYSSATEASTTTTALVSFSSSSIHNRKFSEAYTTLNSSSTSANLSTDRFTKISSSSVDLASTKTRVSSSTLSNSSATTSGTFTSLTQSLIAPSPTASIIYPMMTSIIYPMTSSITSLGVTVSTMPTIDKATKILTTPVETTTGIYSSVQSKLSSFLESSSVFVSGETLTVSTSVSINRTGKGSSITSSSISQTTPFIFPPYTNTSKTKSTSVLPTTVATSSIIPTKVTTPTPSIASTVAHTSASIPLTRPMTTIKPTDSSEKPNFYANVTLTMIWKNFCKHSEEFRIGLANLLHKRIKEETGADQVILLNLGNCYTNPDKIAVVKFYISVRSSREPNKDFTQTAVEILADLISGGKTTELGTNFVNGTFQKVVFVVVKDDDSDDDWPVWLIILIVIAAMIFMLWLCCCFWIFCRRKRKEPKRKYTFQPTHSDEIPHVKISNEDHNSTNFTSTLSVTVRPRTPNHFDNPSYEMGTLSVKSPGSKIDGSPSTFRPISVRLIASSEDDKNRDNTTSSSGSDSDNEDEKENFFQPDPSENTKIYMDGKIIDEIPNEDLGNKAITLTAPININQNRETSTEL